MAKFRFRGTERHSVPVLGRTVDPKEIVEVPDELVWVEGRDNPPTARVWPEEMWSQIDAPKKSAAVAKAGE